MPDSFTANLNLTKPEIGASDDTWGNKSNTNWDTVDAKFASSGAGRVVLTDASNQATGIVGQVLAAAAGVARFVTTLSGTAKRWAWGAEPTAESGANAGSNWLLQRYADDGTTLLGIALAFTRANGVGTFEATPQVGANQIYHQGNLPAVIASVSEPVGTVKMYAGVGGTDPPGGFYMLCDGRAVSRTTFASLFTALGTAYGAGDGSTTFNIPNTAERVLVGQSAAQSLIPQFDARVLGGTFGEGRHTLAAGELPAHTHPITDPGHFHAFTYSRQAVTSGAGLNCVNTIDATGDNINTQTASKVTGITQTDANVGGGAAHNVVQPSLVVNFIIRVK